MEAKDDIEKEVRDRLPRKVGVVAVNHFRQNFRDAGWRDNGLRLLGTPPHAACRHPLLKRAPSGRPLELQMLPRTDRRTGNAGTQGGIRRAQAAARTGKQHRARRTHLLRQSPVFP